jgi:hypothetical protein
MKPPFALWIRDEDTVQIFQSDERLVGSVESIDVDEGLYWAFDGEGRRLRLRVDRKGKRPRLRRFFSGLEPVILEEAEEEPSHEEMLRDLIARNLGRLGVDPQSLEELPLADLLNHPDLERG